VRADAQRERDSLERQYESRLSDERRQHDRDLESRKTSAESQRSAEKAALDAEIRQQKNEIDRLNRECDRLRAEAEKNANLVERLGEFEELACKMGFARGGEKEEPDDWKSMVKDIALSTLPNLGDIIRSGGDAVAAIRHGGGRQQMTPQQHQAYQQQVRQMHPPVSVVGDETLAFATDDGGFDAGALPPPLNPPRQFEAPPPESYGLDFGSASDMAPEQHQVFQPEPPTAHATPQAQQSQPPPQAMVPLQQSQPQPAAPQVQPQQPQQQQPQQPAAPEITDEQILQFVPAIEAAINAGEEPNKVATELRQMYGADVVQFVAQALQPSRVAEVVMQRMENGHDHPLVKRAGQAWLRELQQQIALLPQQ